MTTLSSVKRGSSSENFFVPGRPLIILAGWLGGTEGSLRRYEDLYRRLGFNVCIRIASPSLIVQAAMSLKDSKKRRLRNETIASMEDLAWNVLKEIQASRCSVFLFHGFSNGGSFLWEAIQCILQSSSSSSEGPSQQTEPACPSQHDTDELDLSILRKKLIGVIFDSSPCYYSTCPEEAIRRVIQWAPWYHRVFHYFNTTLINRYNHYLFSHQQPTNNNNKHDWALKQRAQEFWSNMMQSDIIATTTSSSSSRTTVPQLYIYSENDLLTPYKPLEELIRYRQRLIGRKHFIYALRFQASRHCCHLLYHPEEYRAAVENFVDRCCYYYHGGGGDDDDDDDVNKENDKGVCDNQSLLLDDVPPPHSRL